MALWSRRMGAVYLLVTAAFFTSSIYLHTHYTGNCSLSRTLQLPTTSEKGHQQEAKGGALNQRLLMGSHVLNSTIAVAELRSKTAIRSSAHVKKTEATKKATAGARRVLVSAYYRGGSSFAGELVSSAQPAFYMFEPLFLYRNDTLVKARILSKLFACNFTFLLEAPFRGKPWIEHRLFSSPRAVAIMRSKVALPGKLTKLGRMCAENSMVVIKTIRFPAAGFSLLDSALNVAFIHVVRDPRGILASQRAVAETWTDLDTLESAASRLCAQMEGDLSDGDAFSRAHPTRYYRLRYEDLAANTSLLGTRIGRFLQRSEAMARHLPAFVKWHCSRSDRSEYGTRRVCAEQAGRWREQLTWTHIERVQSPCRGLLAKLGYRLASLPGPVPLAA